MVRGCKCAEEVPSLCRSWGRSSQILLPKFLKTHFLSFIMIFWSVFYVSYFWNYVIRHYVSWEKTYCILSHSKAKRMRTNFRSYSPTKSFSRAEFLRIYFGIGTGTNLDFWAICRVISFCHLGPIWAYISRIQNPPLELNSSKFFAVWVQSLCIGHWGVCNFSPVGGHLLTFRAYEGLYQGILRFWLG